jgi:hypothetical protein
MPLSFPASPTIGQTSLQNGREYVFVGGKVWELVASTSSDPRWALFLPAAPTGVTATASNAQAVVSWTAPAVAVPPVTDYVVQFSTNGGSTWTTFTDAVSTATSATITGLTNGSAYTFRAAAINGIGTGAYSTASSAVTPLAGDPLFGSVDLLLHMDGTGNTFVDSSAFLRSVTANGDVTQSAAQSRFGGKSGLFDGNGDYLGISGSGNGFAFGTGDFVYEWWFRSAATNAYAAMVTRPYNSPGGILMTLNGASGNGRPEIFWREFENAQFMQSDTGGFNDNNWHHFAFVRSGTTCSMYIDGVRRATRTSVSTSVPTSVVVVGNDIEYGGREFGGNIDELRITRGNDRGYTGATITVPSLAFPEATPGTDPFYSSVSLLLPMDTAFTDLSSAPKTLANTGGAISTAQIKNGAGSGLFNISGGTNVLRIDDNAGFGFQEGDSFTVECWYYPTSFGAYNYIISKGSGNAFREWALGVTGSAVVWYRKTGGDISFAPSATVSLNQWTHLAAVCDGTNVTLFKDGVSLGSTEWGTPDGYGNFQPLWLMQFLDFRNIAHEARGYIDNVRITKGVARYTDNFTPSATAFPTA